MPPGYYGATPEKRSPVLGAVGLGLVVVFGIVYYVSWLHFFQMAMQMGIISSTGSISDLTPEQTSQLALPIAGLAISTIAGLTGFVISIVATARNAGRPMGIVGIVLGVVAPFTVLAAAATAVAG